jgi:glycosyltransferase involved in cell wall biosynthesis
LYAGASLFVLPSLDEGFGLPALEAMASGAPVIVSDGGALPEVVGDAGMTFCLSDPQGLKQSMKECLSNARVREELRERGLERAKKFSWQVTAEIVWENLHALSSTTGRRLRTHRSRISESGPPTWIDWPLPKITTVCCCR